MKIKILTLALLLLTACACQSVKTDKPLPRLNLYSGYVHGMDEAGYYHGVDALITEMKKDPEFFSATELKLIRFGDRNSVQATPILTDKLPSWPQCKRTLFRAGESERAKRCREEKEQANKEFEEKLLKFQQALKSAPKSPECVSYANLMIRLRSEPNLPPSIVISDGGYACPGSDKNLEPLSNAKGPIILIQIATEFGFTEHKEFLTRILQPKEVIPGTSAEQAVRALKEAVANKKTGR